MIRLQRFMAEAGVASRRKSEGIILEGRVKVNGEPAEELGIQIDPDKDVVTVDGEVISRENKSYVLMNKPKGYVCTAEDEHAERTVFDILPNRQRLHTVGRLDKQSEGLLLLTNDGELTQHLTHPSNEVEKTYRVTIKGKLKPYEYERLTRGVLIEEDDGTKFRTKPAKVKIVSEMPRTSVLEMTISEGRKRQIRKMLRAVGHRVIRLIRIREGKLELGDLRPGSWRFLSKEEVEMLKND